MVCFDVLSRSVVICGLGVLLCDLNTVPCDVTVVLMPVYDRKFVSLSLSGRCGWSAVEVLKFERHSAGNYCLGRPSKVSNIDMLHLRVLFWEGAGLLMQGV